MGSDQIFLANIRIVEHLYRVHFFSYILSA